MRYRVDRMVEIATAHGAGRGVVPVVLFHPRGHARVELPTPADLGRGGQLGQNQRLVTGPLNSLDGFRNLFVGKVPKTSHPSGARKPPDLIELRECRQDIVLKIVASVLFRWIELASKYRLGVFK